MLACCGGKKYDLHDFNFHSTLFPCYFPKIGILILRMLFHQKNGKKTLFPNKDCDVHLNSTLIPGYFPKTMKVSSFSCKIAVLTSIPPQFNLNSALIPRFSLKPWTSILGTLFFWPPTKEKKENK